MSGMLSLVPGGSGVRKRFLRLRSTSMAWMFLIADSLRRECFFAQKIYLMGS